ncbi:MAG: hypothetical protein KDI24_00675 [Pseudomonadales bacterium]|nr:hypothetical protein [Pseudomonadales bacterium]MCP5172865.1 hypothetical protein [Pseudomonadales bacterium]MCP5302339.1 hypothetical protein [Pseudomonadales bacterium]
MVKSLCSVRVQRDNSGVAVLKINQAMAVLLTVLFSSQWALASENLYRYRNLSGEVVIDYQVPPEFVANGYEVLSKTGRVLQVVPPHTVVDEGEQASAQQSSEEAEAQKKEDTILLRSYSSLADLEKARDRRLELLDREITIVESNLEKSREQLESSRAQAANHQRSGRVVPRVLLDNISDLEEQIEDAEQMSVVRASERREVSEKYRHYIERFMVLKGLQRGARGEKNHPSKLAIDPASSQSDGD